MVKPISVLVVYSGMAVYAFSADNGPVTSDGVDLRTWVVMSRTAEVVMKTIGKCTTAA